MNRVNFLNYLSTGRGELDLDDMQAPVMTAIDKTFAWGQLGLGSFDDTADWDDLVLKAVEVGKQEFRLLPVASGAK